MAKNNPQITLRKLVRAFTSTTKPKLLRIAGELIVNDALNNFKKEAYEGSKWKKRDADSDEYAAMPREKRRALLVGFRSGRLRRSIRVVKVSTNSVVVGSDVKYAARHNLGLKNMPKRQFLGFSKELKAKINKTIRENFL